MVESEYTRIFSGNFIIVQMLMERLHNSGINAVIKDESESGRLAGFGASIQGFQEVFVSKDQLDKAVPIVAQVESEVNKKENPEV